MPDIYTLFDKTPIIDIKSDAELSDTWKAFMHTHHYNVTNDFYESLMGLFPRRTCEAQWNYDMPEKEIFYPHNPIPRKLEFEELWEWCSPLIKAEKKRARREPRETGVDQATNKILLSALLA